MVPGFLKPLLKAYFLLEEGYYDALDAVEEKLSVPIYDWYVNPLESKGIPSFLVTIFLLLILSIGSLLVLVSQVAAPTGLQVLVYGKTSAISGQPLDNAVVQILINQEVISVQQTRRGLADFLDAPSAELTVTVTKTGFSDGTSQVDTRQTNVLRLELTCSDAKTCAELEAAAGYKKSSGSGSNTPHLGNISFSPPDTDVDPSLTTGRLLVLVRSEDGDLLDARVTVIDAKSQGRVDEIPVSQGAGILSGLSIGKQLYVNVFSQGYLPFFGGNDSFVIQPAINKITVVLKKAQPGDLIPTTIHVTEQNGSAISGAQINLFLSGHAAVLYSDYSDADGLVSLELANGTYFSSAFKQGYLTNYSQPFEAGDSIFIALTSLGDCVDGICANEAQVLAHVLDEQDANVSYADVVLQMHTNFGESFVVGQTYSGYDGTALFTSLAPLSNITILASDYDRRGSANATLLQGLNRVNVTISKPPFLVNAFAVDAISHQFVESARFESFADGNVVGSCQGNGCELRMLSATELNVSVTAQGFVGSSNLFYLYEGVDGNITLFLVNESILNDSYVQWLGIYADNGRPAGDLVPGKSYQVRLGLFNQDANSSGVVFDSGYDGAYVSSVAPAGFYQKGGYAQSCYGSDLDFGEYASQNAWADIRYNGAANGPVAFNLTIDPFISLDASTKTKNLSLSYRSYILRENDFLRNPFDNSLGVLPAQDHPSGCPGQVTTYSQNVTVKSTATTCTEIGCVSLDFAQGQNHSTQGLNVESFAVTGNKTPNYVRAFYTIELFTPPVNAKIRLLSPESGILWYNATTPIIGPGNLQGLKTCNFRNGRVLSIVNNSFELNLSDLAACSTFNLPLRIEGVAVGRPLQSGRANVSVSLLSDSKNATHSSHVNIQGFGVSANRFGIVEAKLSQENNGNADAEPFGALSTGECTPSQVAQGTCDVGFLTADVSVTALDDSSFAVSFSPGVGLTLYDQRSPSSTDGSRGSRANASARFTVPANESVIALSISKSGSTPTQLVRNVSLSGGVHLNGSSPFPPGWDTCQGFVGVRYDPSLNPPLSLGSGCTDLAFRVSPIFPADAVLLNISTPDYGRIVTRAAKTDGSDTCYEVCEIDASGYIYGCEALGKSLYNQQQYLLRYNPELRATCPAKYHVNGNMVAGSEIDLEFAYTGDQIARRNVTLHVLNDSSDRSLYISPVYTFYGSASQLLFPQLWAVTNLKQLGKRKVLFKQPSNYSVSFDGPGTKIVAMVPGAFAIQAFDTTNSNVPIFDSSGQSSLSAVSRYGMAVVSLSNSVDFNIPGFAAYTQALTNLVAVSVSENAFLDVPTADKLSGSVPKLANRTAYWRSSEVVRYCQTTTACQSSYNTLPGCCRESVDDWKNITFVQDFSAQSCTFCNNTFNPSCEDETQEHLNQYLACTNQPSANLYSCDQRCTPQTVLRAVSPFMGQAIDAAGITGTGATVLNYGDVLGGRTCEVKFSSLIPFVERSFNNYGYYNPATPLVIISNESIVRCQAGSGCPLVFANQSIPGFPGISQSILQCVSDENNDGLWQDSETLTNSVARNEPIGTVTPGGFRPSHLVHDCGNSIVAVNESAFFVPAVQNGVVVSRNTATSADVQRCRNGLCSLLLNPVTSADSPGVPFCFTGPTSSGFVNVRTAPVNNFVAAVPDGFGGFQCPSGILAVANFCFSSCENYCAAPNCDPSPLCMKTGVKQVASGEPRRVFNGWLNQSPVVAVFVDSRFLSRGLKHLPAGMFSDAFQASADSFQSQAQGKPVFSASYVVNSKNAPNAMRSLTAVLSVDGCDSSSNYPYAETRLPDQGLYTIRDYNVLDSDNPVWASDATAVELKPSDYLGARIDTCRKPNWNTRVCETTFVDQSSQYGNCFNSILQYSGGPKRPGVDLALVGGLGFGVKQGVGFGVAPDGQVFALGESGQHFANICGGQARGIDPTHGYDDKHKYDVDKQTLLHWRADGRYDTSRDFYWQQDLGCSKDCGCKPAGGKGYGLLSILLPLVLIILAVFAAPALAGALTGLGATGPVASAAAFSTGLSAGAANTISSLAFGIISSGISSASIGLMTPASSLANVASNVISSIGVGNVGDCLPWAFGTATAMACKGVLWTLGAG